MLHLELTGQKYSKADHRRALMGQLNNRSPGSVEWKHQNISAVLNEMGIPCIEGYKPGVNYQRSILPDVISEYLKRNPEIQELFMMDSDLPCTIPLFDDLRIMMEVPPKEKGTSQARINPILCNPAGINYLEREARNQELGNAGEACIISFERARLIRAGRERLADRIEHVSETQGPSAGFDILSYENNGKDRFIEVKTTKYGKSTPFFITQNELAFSQENASRYFLYRLFSFRNTPRMFSLHGRLQDQCNLRPSQFIAKAR